MTNSSKSRPAYLRSFDMAALFLVLEACHLVFLRLGLLTPRIFESTFFNITASLFLLLAGGNFTVMGILMKREIALVTAKSAHSAPQKSDS